MCCKNLLLKVSVFFIAFAFGFSGTDLLIRQSSTGLDRPAAPNPVCTKKTDENSAEDRIVEAPCDVDPRISVSPPIGAPFPAPRNLECVSDIHSFLMKKRTEISGWLATNKRASKERTAKLRDLDALNKRIALLEKRNKSEKSSPFESASDLLYREKCFESFESK